MSCKRQTRKQRPGLFFHSHRCWHLCHSLRQGNSEKPNGEHREAEGRDWRGAPWPSSLGSKQAHLLCGLWGRNSLSTCFPHKKSHTTDGKILLITTLIIQKSETFSFPKPEHTGLAIHLFSNSAGRQTQLMISVAHIYERVMEKCISFIKGRISSYKDTQRGHRRSLALLSLE